MSVARLQGKRSGRPRGSRSRSQAILDLRWAAQNVGKDREPPTPGAAFWNKMAHEQPEKFVVAVAAMDAANTRPREEQQNGNVMAHAGRNLKKLFLSDNTLMQAFRQYSKMYAPLDGKVVECRLIPAPGGILLTVSSSEFPPVPDGDPVPELAPRHAYAQPARPKETLIE